MYRVLLMYQLCSYLCLLLNLGRARACFLSLGLGLGGGRGRRVRVLLVVLCGCMCQLLNHGQTRASLSRRKRSRVGCVTSCGTSGRRKGLSRRLRGGHRSRGRSDDGDRCGQWLACSRRLRVYVSVADEG